MNGPYDDIIHLPRHVSAVHPPMPMADRAAQFSPFAALSGYGDAIRESARLTGRRIELDEDAQAALDEKLGLLAGAEGESPEISVTYFLPDRKKSGGAYVTAAGRLKKLDGARRVLRLQCGTEIPLEDILEIESGLFPPED